MADPKPPQLPQGAPADLRAFIDCTGDKVTLRNGRLDWLPLPDDIKDWAPVPDITYGDAPTPGSVTITVSMGISFELTASVQEGQLTVDTNGLPGILSGAREFLDQWVKDLNDWLRHNKKQLKRPRIRPGEITLEKVPLAAPRPSTTTPVVPGPPTTPAPPTAGATGTPTQPPPPSTGGSGGWGCGGIFFLGLVLLLVLAVGAIGLGIVRLPTGEPAAQTPTSSPMAVATPTAEAGATPTPRGEATPGVTVSPFPSPSSPTASATVTASPGTPEPGPELAGPTPCSDVSDASIPTCDDLTPGWYDGAAITFHGWHDRSGDQTTREGGSESWPDDYATADLRRIYYGTLTMSRSSIDAFTAEYPRIGPRSMWGANAQLRQGDEYLYVWFDSHAAIDPAGISGTSTIFTLAWPDSSDWTMNLPATRPAIRDLWIGTRYLSEFGSFATDDGNVRGLGETDLFGPVGPDGTPRYNRDARSICVYARGPLGGVSCLVPQNRRGPYFRLASYIRDEQTEGPAAYDVFHGPGGPLAFMPADGDISPYLFSRVGTWYTHDPIVIGDFEGGSQNGIRMRAPSWRGLTGTATVDLTMIEDGRPVDFSGLPIAAFYADTGGLWLDHPLNRLGPHLYRRIVIRWTADGQETNQDVTLPFALAAGGVGYMVTDDVGPVLGREQ